MQWRWVWVGSRSLWWTGKPRVLQSMGHKESDTTEWLNWTELVYGSESPWWLRKLRICLQCRRPGFDPWFGKIPWIMEWQPTPVFIPGEFHGQRSLVGYSPWGCKKVRHSSTINIVMFMTLVASAPTKQTLALIL